jgi:hypothetical protein
MYTYYLSRMCVIEIDAYCGSMQESLVNQLADQALVVAITHDHAKIWLLHDGTSEVKLRVNRSGEGTNYKMVEESHRAQSQEIGVPQYFTTLMKAVEDASSIYIVGHGKGKANASEEFVRFVESHDRPLSEKMTSLGSLSLTRMSDGEIFKEAQHRWTNLLR